MAQPADDDAKPFDLEKTVIDRLARQKWGADAPWYLPEAMIGDLPYRYQGVAVHSGLAASPGMPAWARLANLGYVGYALGSGRTQRPRIADLDFPAEATDPAVPPSLNRLLQLLPPSEEPLPGGVGNAPY